MGIFADVVLVVIVSSNVEFFTSGHPLEKEPTCYSKFDYDAKLLERLLLVEHRMKLVEEKSEKATTEMEQFRESAKDVADQAATQQTTFMDDVTVTMETVQSEMVTQQKAFMDGATATMETLQSQLAKDQTLFMDGATTALNTTQARINASLEKYSEEIKKSKAVAFYARYTGTSRLRTSVILPFSTAMLNTNNVYDTQTGYFTAPTAGLYLFSVQICGHKSNTINFRIQVNRAYISETTEYDSDIDYHCTTSNAVAMLDVGDKVSVKTAPNYSGLNSNTFRSEDYRWSTFLGVLLK